MAEQKVHKRKDVWSLVSLATIALYAIFLIYPLFILLKQAVIVDGTFSLSAFKAFFSPNFLT